MDITCPRASNGLNLLVQAIATSRLKNFQFTPTTGVNLIEAFGRALPESETLEQMILGHGWHPHADARTYRTGHLHGDVVASFLRQRPQALRIKILVIHLQVWSDQLENALEFYLRTNTFVRAIRFVVLPDYSGPAQVSDAIVDAIDLKSCCLEEIKFVGCERTVDWHLPLVPYFALKRFRLSHGERFATIGQHEDDVVNRLRLVLALETLDATMLYMFFVRKDWHLLDYVFQYWSVDRMTSSSAMSTLQMSQLDVLSGLGKREEDDNEVDGSSALLE